MPESLTRLERAQSMKPSDFKRHYGVHWQTFTTMIDAYQAAQTKKKKSGRPAALTLAEQILFTLEFFLILKTHLTGWIAGASTQQCSIMALNGEFTKLQRFVQSGVSRMP